MKDYGYGCKSPHCLRDVVLGLLQRWSASSAGTGLQTGPCCRSGSYHRCHAQPVIFRQRYCDTCLLQIRSRTYKIPNSSVLIFLRHVGPVLEPKRGSPSHIESLMRSVQSRHTESRQHTFHRNAAGLLIHYASLQAAVGVDLFPNYRLRVKEGLHLLIRTWLSRQFWLPTRFAYPSP
jgi:hypothetical protein